jgi:predicted glycoside hydrolase/deacetylase ChbG (UPF0249 family)
VCRPSPDLPEEDLTPCYSRSQRRNPRGEVLAIVNADDLGMSHEINEAIFDLMRCGRITSASLLANAPATREAIQRVPEFPRCSFGAHLNICQYAPLTGLCGLLEHLERDGQMSPFPIGYRLSMAALRAIYAEYSAQIESLLAKGVPIDHIDTHMHVHFRPALFPVMKALQRRYEIRGIRTSANIPSSRRGGILTQTKRSVYHWAVRHTCKTTTTEAAADLAGFIASGRQQHPGCRTVELIAHPANPYYPEDLQLLLSPWEKGLPFPVRFLSFRQLRLA